jgi:hypothetical protein
MIVDFNGGPIHFRRERGEYLHSWLDIVRESVKLNSPLVLKNWTWR